MTAGLVTGRLGISVRLTPSAQETARFDGSLELGLRQNPRRAQLLVSRLLGKHIPVPVGDVLRAAHALGSLVRVACAARRGRHRGSPGGVGLFVVAAVSAADLRSCAVLLHDQAARSARRAVLRFERNTATPPTSRWR
jgi:hypothetical protein